jgi:hypothetical protein
MKTNILLVALASVIVGVGLMIPQVALSPCDTMDGPVVQAAKGANEHHAEGHEATEAEEVHQEPAPQRTH